MSRATVDLDALILDKHRAVQLAREWQAIAAALILEHSTVINGQSVGRVSKAMLNKVNHNIEAKPVKGGGVIITLTPKEKEG